MQAVFSIDFITCDIAFDMAILPASISSDNPPNVPQIQYFAPLQFAYKLD